VLKTTEIFHAIVKYVLSGMTKRGMSQIMGKRNRFGQILIKVQHSGNRPGDLRHFNRVRQPGAKHITLMVHKDLCFILKPPESSTVHYPVTIALILCTVIRWRFFEPPAARIIFTGGVGS
jgi:hypothetical protein